MEIAENQQPSIILASTSPRRRELLALMGWQYEVIPAEVDETPYDGEPADEYVFRLAQAKAVAVAEWLTQEDRSEAAYIIAADTTVADRGKILGKPQNEAEAQAMLHNLRGRTHQVYTAVSILETESGKAITELCSTDVPMRDYSQAEIDAYIASGDPFDKAGGYAIQHPGFRPVSSLTGCYANVVGLPLCHLLRAARQFGLTPQTELSAACQRTLQYDCKIYRKVQKGEL
ncbi:MAG TPA: Maf family protein [Anaerolineales bacterium]|nr:Maf family protein [Anaerolineales bacterium]